MRERRQRLGLSQQALASGAGVAIRSVIRIENGEDTKVSTLSAVATRLGCTAADLLVEREDSPAPLETV